AILMCGTGHVITYWNRGAELTYGYSREEGLGRSAPELRGTQFPVPLAEIEAQLARDGSWRGDLTQRRRDGLQLAVDGRWTLQRGSEGQPAGTIELNRDITARKQAELALAEQAALLDQALDAILMCGPGHVITYWNRGAELTYGYSREEAVGRSAPELLGTQFPVPLAEIEAQLARDGSWRGDLTQRRRDGLQLAVD